MLPAVYNPPDAVQHYSTAPGKRQEGSAALALLRGEFREGETVRVDARDGAVVFGK